MVSKYKYSNVIIFREMGILITLVDDRNYTIKQHVNENGQEKEKVATQLNFKTGPASLLTYCVS